MPVLKNRRHEKVAQAIARGIDGTHAYMAAYPTSTPAAAAVSANRLINNARFKARLAELNGPALKALEKASEKSVGEAITSAERIVREAARIAFADIRDAVSWDGDNLILKDSAELTPDQAAAIKEVRIVRIPGEYGDRVEKRVTLYDKLGALQLLARRHPEFSEKYVLDARVSGGVVIQRVTRALDEPDVIEGEFVERKKLDEGSEA